MQRPVALLAALVIAVMATAACFHHHGPLVLDASPDHPSLVGVSDEGPSACAVCAGDPAMFESAPVAAPAPETAAVRPRFEVAPANEVVDLASAAPRSPPAPAAPAV